MSCVRLIIRDAQRDIYADRHGAFADRVIAALSAEPETIEELEIAVERFEARPETGFFHGFYRGLRDEPYDPGLVVVDLAARLIVCDSTYSWPGRDGDVTYHDGHCATDTCLRYHLPDDWEITSESIDWQWGADKRRSKRLATPPLDARAVLYGGALVEFIARECFEAFRGLGSVPAGDEVEDPDDDARREQYKLIRGIHARWLTTARDDLRGQAPRDVLLAKLRFLDWDLQDREQQWSSMERCPRGLDRESAAYRFAAFGRHEVVTYYYLTRHLLWSCHDSVRSLPAAAGTAEMSAGDFLTDEVPRLSREREVYLDSPEHGSHGWTPRRIIENERARLPMGMESKQAIIDHDCPLCQMQADMPGPMFWHLDGCNMDDDFAFSFHRTQQEWDDEQSKWDEHSRQFAAEKAEEERLGVKYPRDGYADPDYAWDESFSKSGWESDSIFIRLFSIGSDLAHLIADFKMPYWERELPAERRDLIDRLSRDFGNLREVMQSSDVATAAALVDPVLDRFRESLDALAAAANDLEPACTELQNRLRRFLEPARETEDEENDDLYGGSDEIDDDSLPF